MGCSNLGDDLNGLKAAIVALQDKLESFTSPSPDSLNQLYCTEEIIQEVAERTKRQNNIVVYNVPEINNSTKGNQLVADQTMVTNMLSVLGVQEAPVSVLRLGKFDSTNTERKRPIKVILSSNLNIPTIFRSSKKLKTIDGYKHLSISSDKTPFQTKLYKKTKDELYQRQQKGESNIALRYIRGIPKIVPIDEQEN